jgi:hypothetical protein
MERTVMSPSKQPRDLIRVGVITGPAGHTNPIWGEKMNPPPGKIRTTGMRLTHAYSANTGMVGTLSGKYPDVDMVDDPRDMIGQIDGLLIDDFNAISLYPLLARPFLEAGVPTFINRPFATSLAKGQEMVDTAARHSTALLSASTWEFSESVGDLRAKAAEMPVIKGYVAHNSMSDYYSHGLHGVWYIHAALSEEIRRGRGRMTAAAYHAPNWRVPGGLVVYEHESPEGPYYGAYHMFGGGDGQASLRIFGGPQGDAEGKIPARPAHFMYNTWNAMPLVIQEMFETGESPQSGEEMMEKLAMFLLPFHSTLECGGAMVGREALDDWEAPPPSEALKLDGRPTDSAFIDPYTPAQLEELERRLT